MLITRDELFDMLMKFAVTYGRKDVDDTDVEDFIQSLEDRGDLDFSDDEWMDEPEEEQSY